MEGEIESLRIFRDNSMQLVNVSAAPNSKDDANVSTDDEEVKKLNSPAFRRRQSSLNPTAPEFGPRGSKTDHSKEMLPLLRKYANESALKATGQPLERQDARGFSGESFELPQRTAAKLEFHGTPSGFASRPNDPFGTRTGALIPSGAPPQSRFRSIADFANVDFSSLQNKVNWDADDVSLSFVRLFGMMEGLIAKHHITAPYNEKDSMLSFSYPATWNYILSMGLKNQTQSAAHMTDLLTRFECRHWVMKRIIVDYIINRLIVPEVFFGFNEAIDHHLYALQGRMKAKAPGTSKFPLKSHDLDDITNVTWYQMAADPRDSRDNAS